MSLHACTVCTCTHSELCRKLLRNLKSSSSCSCCCCLAALKARWLLRCCAESQKRNSRSHLLCPPPAHTSHACTVKKRESLKCWIFTSLSPAPLLYLFAVFSQPVTFFSCHGEESRVMPHSRCLSHSKRVRKAIVRLLTHSVWSSERCWKAASAWALRCRVERVHGRLCGALKRKLL